MARQLFYGKLDGISPIGNGSNSYIRVRFDATTSSTTLTNVTDVTGYFGIDYVRVGQQLVESSAFPTGTTITAVDVANQTITVEDNPATAESQGLGRVSPAYGDYYIASASLTDPQGLINFTDITGSDDTDFDSDDGTVYAVLGQAANTSQTSIAGRFHQYTISEVFYRNGSGTEGSVYIKWGEKGTQTDSGDELLETANQKFAVVGLTEKENLAPIFSNNLAGITDLNNGESVAGFQIQVQDFLDDITQADIYYTGSLTQVNAQSLNFSGSGVEVTTSGSEGVLVTINGGGGGDAFPFDGNAVISGSLLISGSESVATLNLNDTSEINSRKKTLASGSDSLDVFTIDRTLYYGYTLDYVITDDNDSQRVGTFRVNIPSSSALNYDDTSTLAVGNVVTNTALAAVGSGDDVILRMSRTANDTDINFVFYTKLFKR